MLVNGRHISLGSYAQKADANAALRNALEAQDAGHREGRITFGNYANEWIAAATTWPCAHGTTTRASSACT